MESPPAERAPLVDRTSRVWWCMDGLCREREQRYTDHGLPTAMTFPQKSVRMSRTWTHFHYRCGPK